jgi:DnaJ homolog subfamily A member 2
MDAVSPCDLCVVCHNDILNLVFKGRTDYLNGTSGIPNIMSSLYETLGVERDASVEEIRRAYKDLAKVHHPDRGGDPEKFKKIQEAHEVLSDEGKRRMYDVTGSVEGAAEGPHGGMAAGGIPFEFMRGMGPFGMPGVQFDIGSMFGSMFGGGGGPGGPGGPGGRRRGGKGPNKHSDIALNLADFYNGRDIKLKFNQSRRCEGCGGSGAEKSEPCGPCGGRGVRARVQMIGPGMVAQSMGPCDVCSGDGKRVLQTCKRCHGKKFVEREKELTVAIKPGMHEGQALTFAGECSDSAEYDTPGDVVLTLKRADPPQSEVDAWEWRGGADLWIRIRITFAESVLGFTKTLLGHPSGKQLPVRWRGGPLVHGAVLQAPDWGMPRKESSSIRSDGTDMPNKTGSGHGVCYIQVFVAPPEAREWSPEDRSMLQKILGAPVDTMDTADVIQLAASSLESKMRPEV